jgi:hypothetical protein
MLRQLALPLVIAAGLMLLALAVAWIGRRGWSRGPWRAFTERPGRTAILAVLILAVVAIATVRSGQARSEAIQARESGDVFTVSNLLANPGFVTVAGDSSGRIPGWETEES